jgi:hypothetical protein
MSDDGGAMIALMMGFMVSCVVSATSFGYTCTGGTFDLEKFDVDRCFELPEEDDGSGGGGGGGGGGSAQTPESKDLVICDAQFFSNESRTCFTGSQQVGVRWAWLNSDVASGCREKVGKYLIEVSSSSDNHNKKYMYKVVGKDANSIIISGASQLMTSSGNSQNVRIYITPLDSSGSKLSDTATAEVDTGSSNTDTCDVIGGAAVPFADFVPVTTQEEENATDCVGGTWSDPGPCIADDGVTELTGEVGKCGAGTALRTLSGQTPASGGGSCVVEKRERCTKPCPVETPTPCVLARLPNGEINWNPYPGTPDYNDTCKKQCAESGATTENIFASADVLEDAVGTGACNFTQTTTCTCPKDCVGHWQQMPSESKRNCTDNYLARNTVYADYKVEKFIVDQDENETGQCPDKGKTRRTRGVPYKIHHGYMSQETRHPAPSCAETDSGPCTEKWSTGWKTYNVKYCPMVE